MPEQNGQLEQKVEHILVNKGRLLWGIVIATLALGAVFAELHTTQALTNQKLDTLISGVSELKQTFSAEQKEQNTGIATLRDFKVKVSEILKIKE